MPITLQTVSTSPEAHLNDWLNAGGRGLLALDYRLQRFWASSPAEDRLVAVYEPRPDGSTHFLVQAHSEALLAALETVSSLAELADELGADWFATDSVIALQPVHIPKPWGEEIWYTGMEDRGVAGAGHAGRDVPLPWLLSALPDALCHGRERELMLLKILAPRSEEVFGDLYFELHEEKREVYVVTAVDRSAWPDGVGAIRYGFDPDVRQQYPDDDSFRRAFHQAVADYECVRREIDTLLDERAEHSGEADHEAWLADLPPSLIEAEQKRRAAMNRFTALKPLRVGDVVKVPTLTPHSLQHGVRTVEFQTPVYERLIVAFAQKVLTQAHWDTEEAVALMQLDTPPQPPSELLLDTGGVRVERIVDFPDFEVRRLVVQAGAEFDLPSPDDYALLIVVQGLLALGDCGLAAEQAVLLPRGWSPRSFRHRGAEPLILLLGYPR